MTAVLNRWGFRGALLNRTEMRVRAMTGVGGSCVACQRSTDTAIGLRGAPLWHESLLVLLGMPATEATGCVERYLREKAPVAGPDGTLTVFYHVCASCAGRAHLPPPGLAIQGRQVPVVVPFT